METTRVGSELRAALLLNVAIWVVVVGCQSSQEPL